MKGVLDYSKFGTRAKIEKAIELLDSEGFVVIQPVAPSGRDVPCACGNPECRKGLGFSAEGITTVDTYGHTHFMIVDGRTAMMLNQYIQAYLPPPLHPAKAFGLWLVIQVVRGWKRTISLFKSNKNNDGNTTGSESPPAG